MLWFWYLLVAELLLGGNGHYIEIFAIALRTWILLIFFILWLIHATRKGLFHYHLSSIPRQIFAIGIAVCMNIAMGLRNAHDPRAIVQDAIPFAFFLLLFPAREFVTSDRYPIYQKLIKAHLGLASVVSLMTLFLFSSGISVLQDPSYKWFRDVQAGKITDVGNHFFRIVLPEHLLLVPILLFLLSSIIHGREKMKQWVWLGVAMIPFMVNLSRTYFFSFFIGLLCLFSRGQWKRWLVVSIGSVFLALSLFSVLHLAASRGQSLGFELLTRRFASIAMPETERSAATRKTLLPPIWEKIKKHPVVGSGLGATLSFVDPVSKKTVITRHFDWGYLELWAELGIIGLLSYISLIIYLISHTTGPVRASVAALAFMGITTPVLFHVFGIVLLVFFITMSRAVSYATALPLSQGNDRHGA